MGDMVTWRFKKWTENGEEGGRECNRRGVEWVYFDL